MRQHEGKFKCLKNCHICYIKLKTRIFCGLGSSDPIARQLRKMTIEAKKLSREVVVCETVAIQSRDFLCEIEKFLDFALFHFTRKV